jgi:hypothetical protein
MWDEEIIEKLDIKPVNAPIGRYLDVVRSEKLKGDGEHFSKWYIPCPFCEYELTVSGWWLPWCLQDRSEAELVCQVFKKSGATFCENCRIAFHWGFIDGRVRMLKEVN